MGYTEENINKNTADVLIQIGPDKGKRIGEVSPNELQRLYDNLHGLKEKNSESFPQFEVFHDKLEEFLGAAKENVIQTEIEKQLPDDAFIIPDNLKTRTNYIGKDIREIFRTDEAHLHWLLNQMMNYNRRDSQKLAGNTNFSQTLRTFLHQKGSIGDDEFITKDYPNNVVPLGKYEGQNISDINEKILLSVHKYIHKEILKTPKLFEKHNDFINTLSKILSNKGLLMKIEDEYLYPKDIEFYKKYKGSEFINSTNDPFNEIVRIVDSSGTNGITYKKGKTTNILWFAKFVVLNTDNIVTYYEINLQNAKKSVIMDLVGNVGDLYNITGIIHDQGVRKGVKETVITNVDIVEHFGSSEILDPNHEKKIKADKNELGKKYDISPTESTKKKKKILSEHFKKILYKSNYILQ